jgi:hypothetical protein
MARENENLLEEVYKATKMGLEATQLVIPKVRDESLREQIELQGENYKGMANKAKEMLRHDGRLPEEEDPLKKAVLWGSIQMNTAINRHPKHIAEMMISGTTMGIVDMTKKLNELDDADAGAKKLAEEYIVNEQKNIEDLKNHL